MMKKYQKTFKILGSERLNCSIYGNPKKRLILEDSAGNVYTATTGTNCACGYLDYHKNDYFSLTYHYTRTNSSMIIDYATEV